MPLTYDSCSTNENSTSTLSALWALSQSVQNLYTSFSDLWYLGLPFFVTEM